ncbi:MAG: thrombospondin type 3 repeat-containing protein, partial [Thermoplasmata archaeon]|nr:thrombospondin type 3 repeat-containing protein [Thermoplasmata archaeon]
GPTESAIYNVTINSPPTVIMDEPKELTKYTSNDNIYFSANSTIDPDPEDKLAYDWSSNISKFLGDTKTFYHKLPAGVHKIVLSVSDNHGHTISATKIIAVIKYRVDTDSDGTPDYLDSDDDNDQVPDSEDAFPLDPFEWKDTDSDGVGNNEDTDDDGDNYLDIEDAYPENPDKWEKEKEAGLLSMENILIIMLIVIIILIGVGVGAIRHRSKKRAERAAEAAEMASKMPATAALSGSMLSPRIQDAQVEMVTGPGAQPTLSSGGVPTQTTPLLPGTVQQGYGGGVSPTQPTESTQAIPQHLVSSPDKQIPLQTVQTYMPQSTQPSPVQASAPPGPTIFDQPLETAPATEPTPPEQPGPTPEPPLQPQQEPP